jgi:hypothetical protein
MNPIVLPILVFSVLSFASGECNLNIDVATYSHDGISFDLKAATKRITDIKNYKYTLKRSPYRANIKLRARTQNDVTVLRSFFNLYRYRNHLQHEYQFVNCLNKKCSKNEIEKAIEIISHHALKNLKTCSN